MTILFETDELILENQYESTWLKEKSTNKIVLEDEFNGDPKCGLIDKENKWAIVAGEHLTIWTPEKIKIFDTEILKWIHSLRVKSTDTVEILTDPWSKDPSVWEINIHTFEVIKLRAFHDYEDKEYTDDVNW